MSIESVPSMGLCPHGVSPSTCPICAKTVGGVLKPYAETSPWGTPFSISQQLQNNQGDRRYEFQKERQPDAFQFQSLAQNMSHRFNGLISPNGSSLPKELRLAVNRWLENRITTFTHLTQTLTSAELAMMLQNFQQQLMERLAMAWQMLFVSPIEAILALLASLIAYLEVLMADIRKEGSEWRKRWQQLMTKNPSDKKDITEEIKGLFEKLFSFFECE